MGMKRLVVRWNNAYVNLPVDKIELDAEDKGIVWAYSNGEFRGFFDLGSVQALYVSDVDSEK